MHDLHAHLTDEQLSTYLDDRLDAPERDLAHDHLQSCADCNLTLQELTFTVHALRELPAPPLPRSFQIVEPPRVSLWSRIFGSGIALQGLAGAAAALFVVLLSADMASLTSPAGIVPLSQPQATATKQNVQATMMPAPTSAAARASEAAPAAAPPPAQAPAPAAAPPGAGADQPAPSTSASAPQADSAAGKRLEGSGSIPLETLTARDGSAAASSSVPRLSSATLAAGLVAILLVIIAVVRTVRRA
jgi:hypothetical protein